MKRPNKEDFKVKYNKGDSEICSVLKQYSNAQDKYIDYLEQLTTPVIKYCTFCEEEIEPEDNIAYTEDGEVSHEECLKVFEQHWKDRDNTFDLMNW